MVCPICAICAVPVLLLGISGAGMLQHLPLPSDAVMRQRGCQPFLAPFKLDLPCLTDLAACWQLPYSHCHRALLGAGCREHQLHLVLAALELNSVH